MRTEINTKYSLLRLIFILIKTGFSVSLKIIVDSDVAQGNLDNKFLVFIQVLLL